MSEVRPLYEINSQPKSEGTLLYEDYEVARALSFDVSKPSGEVLTTIQERVRSWIDDQGLLDGDQNYDIIDQNSRYSQESVVRERIGGLIEFLSKNCADEVSSEELKATQLFVDAAVTMFQETPDKGVHPDAEGAFAFIAPIRTSKITPEYGAEIEPIIPAFRYVPNELRSQMMVGLPPFVIDTYKPFENGKKGQIIFCPISPDMAIDAFESYAQLDEADQQKAKDRVKQEANGNPKYETMHPAQWDSWQQAKRIINQTVDYARRRHGTEVAGLSATLPAMTDLGRMIENKEVVITTGHGSTAFLIKEAINATTEKGIATKKSLGKIGILGAGAIGSAMAQIVSKEYPNAAINIYDTRQDRTDNLLRLIGDHAGKLTASESAKDLLEDSTFVLTAVTSQPSLEGVDLRDTIIIDDSQPGAFSPEAVEQKGGFMFWPLAIDKTGQIQRSMFDYGTMIAPDHLQTMFTCEAEVSTLYKEFARMAEGERSEQEQQKIDELMAGDDSNGLTFIHEHDAIKYILQKDYATIGPVTWEKSEKTGKMLDRHNVTVTRNWQALGRSSVPPINK